MSDSDDGASGISDEEIFKRKIMMDGEEMGDSQKIDELLSSFINWCDAEGQTDGEITEGYEKLLMQLDHLELSQHKSFEAQKANARQIEEFEKMFADIEKQVTEVKAVIAQRQLELEEAKKDRLNKMKYDALGRIISSLPDRKESLSKLGEIEEDIKLLKIEKENLIKKADEREKHLGLLLTAAHELKDKFKRELADSEDSGSD